MLFLNPAMWSARLTMEVPAHGMRLCGKSWIDNRFLPTKATADKITSAGVPQVVLPVWSDTYEAPQRAQFLGIGCWGNPRSAPSCTAAEVGPALIKVILGPEAAQMQVRAKEVAELSRRGGHGRTIAAKEILKNLSLHGE